MGPLSSVFDVITFGALFLWFRTSPEVFRTGWFVESIATQTLVIFMIRTRGRPWRDMPSPVLTITTLGALASGLGYPVLAVGRVVWVPGLAAAGSHRAGRYRAALSHLRGIV